jgi:hypothetical protein
MLFLVQPKFKSRNIETDRPIRLWIGLLAICSVFFLFGNAATRNVSHLLPLDGQLELAAMRGNIPALMQIWFSHQNTPGQIADVRSHLDPALRCAACGEDIPAARLLLQWGADPNAPSLANKTAIDIALSTHNAALISLLKNPPRPR